ncbi:hypothetical protein ABT095_12650 [Kitasatospora sp. NPDC002227]|uniref:hypothetical protein n=1 Tax=Kitasatospora sp. NPDC002227 TaxID=3154773 RepID=UPI0033323930
MSSRDQHGREAPTERLLREALAARAGLITAHDLRPADPPSRRPRRLGPVKTAVVTVLALAAALVIGLLTVKPYTVAVPPATSTLYSFRGISLKLPPGWTAAPGQQSDEVCLLAPHQTDRKGRCSPYGVRLITHRSPAEQQKELWPSKEALAGDDNGWADERDCPVWGAPDGGWVYDYSDFHLVGSPVRRTGKVGGKEEADTTWQVSCNAKASYTARMWGLDNYRVFLLASGLKEDYQQDVQSILSSMDFTGFDVPPNRPAAPGDAKVTIDQVTPRPSDGSGLRYVEFRVTMTDVIGGGYGPLGLQVGAPVGSVAQVDWYNGRSWQRVDSSALVAGVASREWQAHDLAPGQSVTVKYRLELMPDQGADIKLGAWVIQVSGEADPKGQTLVAKAETNISSPGTQAP